METDRPKVGVGVIVVRDGKVLLGERLNSHGSGTYQLPGGHVEHGESFEDTARREVEEETGLTDIDIQELVCLKNDRIYGNHFITIGLLATHISGEPRAVEPEKSRNWAWYDVESLPENLFLPSRAVIEHWRTGQIYKPLA